MDQEKSAGLQGHAGARDEDAHSRALERSPGHPGCASQPGVAGTHDARSHSTHSHSTQGQFLLSPKALLCLGAVVWTASVSLSSRGVSDSMPWRTVSQARWETSCPGCGIVEGLTQMKEPHGGRSWRVDVRMSGGGLRPIHSDTALVLGQRVMVDGDRVRPAEVPACR